MCKWTAIQIKGNEKTARSIQSKRLDTLKNGSRIESPNLQTQIRYEQQICKDKRLRKSCRRMHEGHKHREVKMEWISSTIVWILPS